MLKILEKIGSHGAICECFVCKNPYKILDRYSSSLTLVGNQCKDCRSLPNNPPTQALLMQVYDYDADTGLLAYSRNFHSRKKGEDPTSPTSNGYLVLTLDKTYLAHRMIWLRQTGILPEFVDHENHIRTDNRWSNLRDATRQQNAMNKSLNTNNSSGFIGVSYMPSRKKFRASITVNRKSIHLGLFDTAELAYTARQAAEIQHGFHTNHGNT